MSNFAAANVIEINLDDLAKAPVGDVAGKMRELLAVAAVDPGKTFHLHVSKITADFWAQKNSTEIIYRLHQETMSASNLSFAFSGDVFVTDLFSDLFFRMSQDSTAILKAVDRLRAAKEAVTATDFSFRGTPAVLHMS